MLSNFLSNGDRLELSAVDKNTSKSKDGKQNVYNSRIFSILSEETLEIVMPMHDSKLILLPIDAEYNIVFYTDLGLFQCFAKVVDRYKSNDSYLLAISFTSNLRKYQRREYYRFSCALEMGSRNLQEEEIQALEEKEAFILQPNLPVKRSVVVDISGGGLRFISNQKYEVGSFIYCSYHLLKGGEQKLYEIVGQVLAVNRVPNRTNVYEHRVEYYNMDKNTREEIIKFIFEEERKTRK